LFVLAEADEGEADGWYVAASFHVGEDLVVERSQELAGLGVVEADGGHDAGAVEVGVGDDAGEVADGWALAPAEAEAVGVVDVVGDGLEAAPEDGLFKDVGRDEPVAGFPVVALDAAGGDEDGVILAEAGFGVGRLLRQVPSLGSG
jgi:hypothetical protein